MVGVNIANGALDRVVDILANDYGAYREKAERFSNKRSELDWSLCSDGIFSESDLMVAYSTACGIDVLEEEDMHNDFKKYPSLTLEYLNTHCIIPYEWNEETTELTLLIADPYSVSKLLYHFKNFFKRDIVVKLTRRSLIERMINMVYNEDSEAADMESHDDSEETLRSLASEAKIVRLVNEMFSRAVEMRASDIHIEPEETRMVIRFRVDGILSEYLVCPLSQYPAIASRIKLVGGLNIAESRRPQDGRTQIYVGRQDMDIRISTLPTMSGESIVLRILRKDAIAFDLSVIGMLGDMQEKFEKLIKIPHGILLVVGPTGSGKTTTLYSAMSLLNDVKRKIITIEDPVEYQMDRLTQVQVNSNIGLTFANGLRSIVRQDPDVILVGEIRDKETAEIAINAALTGHLVLSTLHTNDAAGAISRLLDMGVEGFLVASSLFGVLSQRLVRKVCSECSGDGKNEDGSKCKKCNGSGFSGRCGIFELLTVNEEMRRAISRNAPSSEIAQIAVDNGMTPLMDDGLRKAQLGMTTRAEVTRAAVDAT
ncbi:GspE/PulE family protein [Lentisphaerota bacterium WC36G]|nr:GspE/PulE family protein [Lentisphaerae bacterium WC36]